MNTEHTEKPTDKKSMRRDHRMFREGRSGRHLNRRQAHIRNAMFRRESHKEMLELFILETIQENPKEITGYQMQTKFNIPRGTLTRHLDKMETEELITSEETTVNGRSQKIFTITEKGRDHLESLRENWAIRGEMLDEMGPVDEFPDRRSQHRHPHHGPPGSRRMHDLHRRRRLSPPFEDFGDKEQAIDFFRGERSRLNTIYSRLSAKVAKIEKERSDLDVLIEKIEAMEVFSTENLKSIFNIDPIPENQQ